MLGCLGKVWDKKVMNLIPNGSYHSCSLLVTFQYIQNMLSANDSSYGSLKKSCTGQRMNLGGYVKRLLKVTGILSKSRQWKIREGEYVRQFSLTLQLSPTIVGWPDKEEYLSLPLNHTCQKGTDITIKMTHQTTTYSPLLQSTGIVCTTSRTKV